MAQTAMHRLQAREVLRIISCCEEGERGDLETHIREIARIPVVKLGVGGEREGFEKRCGDRESFDGVG
jgi:hypothetical protein